MKRLLLALLLLPPLLLPLPAAAQMQFDSNTKTAPPLVAATPGLDWLQSTPASLFDLGMMELSQAANRVAAPLFDINGVVADYQRERNVIALTFYARTRYTEENCGFVLKKIRDSMFPHRTDLSQLAQDLGSYFSTYGAEMPGRPASIGTELAKALNFAVFMPGGACHLPLYGSEEVSYWTDPNAPAPQLPEGAGNMPDLSTLTLPKVEMPTLPPPAQRK